MSLFGLFRKEKPKKTSKSLEIWAAKMRQYREDAAKARAETVKKEQLLEQKRHEVEIEKLNLDLKKIKAEGLEFDEPEDEPEPEPEPADPISEAIGEVIKNAVVASRDTSRSKGKVFESGTESETA